MRQLRSRLKQAYAAFDGAWKANFVGRLITLFTLLVLLALANTLDFEPLKVIDTGNIRIDFPASFAVTVGGAVAFVFAMFGAYVGALSIVRAVISRRPPP